MRWHNPDGWANTLRVLGTMTTELGTTPAVLLYETDSSTDSWVMQGNLPGHDYFRIVPFDQAEGNDVITPGMVNADPMAVNFIFHRHSSESLDSIKRTIEREAKRLGFTPDE